MAKTITQKSITRGPWLGASVQGSGYGTRPVGTTGQYAALGTVTFHVTGGDTISGTDFDFVAENGDVITFTPKKIIHVVNMGGATVTVNGLTYGSDDWDLGEFGGVPCGSSIAVGSGNVFVTFAAN